MKVLSFFPDPYTDELLYSVFARYHVRGGNTSPKITLKELFGNTNASAIIDFPCNLNSIIKNLSCFSNYTSMGFIYENTIYPLFAPFIPEARAKLILKAMKSNNGDSIYTRLGVMASTIKAPEFLRFCPSCFKSDLESYGEAYWHRIHQIPGVILCPKHNTFILNSSVCCHGLNKHEYKAANRDNCRNYPYIIKASEHDMDKLLDLSKNIDSLLSNKIKNKSMEWFHEKYINILINKGYATPNGSLYREAFAKDFYNYYGENFLNLTQAKFDLYSCDNWIFDIVRKPRKVFHPIKHLLLIKFLGFSLEEFFNNKYEYKPFGIGPWPCLNKASSHYHEKVIKDVVITYDNKTKQPVGTFSCSCGFVYSRSGPDKVEADAYRIGRIKRFGAVWEKKLKELNNRGVLSYREMAIQLNVDINTVIKYIKLQCNTSSNTIKNNKNKKQIENIKINLKGSHTKDISKDKKIKAKAKLGVDWEKRDTKLKEEIKELIGKLINSDEKPTRITISRIGRLLKVQALLEKHLEKLPKTKEYLKAVVEDVEAFQIRRVKWAANEIINENKQLSAWYIKRKAGIKTKCLDKVSKAIEDEINNLIRYRKVK
jgi:hypothetical protein